MTWQISLRSTYTWQDQLRRVGSTRLQEEHLHLRPSVTSPEWLMAEVDIDDLLRIVDVGECGDLLKQIKAASLESRLNSKVCPDARPLSS